MTQEELEAKERILVAAMQILSQEDSDPERITVRQIAARAGVGVGLINYHFQNKDNLVKQAIDRMNGEIADQWQRSLDASIADPVERLKAMLKINASVGAGHARLARLSIQYELLRGDLEVPVVILPVLREIFGREKGEQEIRVLAFILVTGLQVMLIREHAFRKYSGINIFDPEQREHWIDTIVDDLTRGV